MIGMRDSGYGIQGGGDLRQVAGLPVSRIPYPLSSKGFTLVEMIMVIVITGIVGGIVAVFLQAPMKQYTDVARRADMTDIADTALRRISRDVRLALPNSVRVTGGCGGSDTCFLEFLPTGGGARYRASPPGDELDFTAADTSFDILGTGLNVTTADRVVVYNLGIPGADAYAGDNTATVSAASAGTNISITSKQFPFESPGRRFHIISTPVSYVCNPASGELRRYWGYAIQAPQPNDAGAAPLSTASSALLATHVSSCRFTYDANVVAQRSGLVTMHLGITEANPDGGNETVTLYNAAHVSNVP